jgi:hypothetical protein
MRGLFVAGNREPLTRLRHCANWDIEDTNRGHRGRFENTIRLWVFWF